jgi:thioredoxin
MATKPIEIQSAAQFSQLLSSSSVVVVDFWAPWCGPCKAIAPVYEQLASQLSRPNQITFTKVNTDVQTQIAQSYNITTIPTFLIFKQGRETERLRGLNPKGLSDAVKKLAQENAASSSSSSSAAAADGGAASSDGSPWLGAPLPRNYVDVTSEIDIKGLDLLNVDPSTGDARILFDTSRPSALHSSSASASASSTSTTSQDPPTSKPDWLETDTDEQLMLYIPFQSTLKIHTLHLTSLRSSSPTATSSSEPPRRPKTIRLYTNRPNILSFDEADDGGGGGGEPATQELVLEPQDWDAATGTAALPLRFVKFQNVSSLVVFVVDGEGEGEGETVRLDRVRVIGESGAKRAMGKLEKIGDEEGE